MKLYFGSSLNGKTLNSILMKIRNNYFFRFLTIMVLVMFIAVGFQYEKANNNLIQESSNQSKKEKPKLKTWVLEGPLPYEIERQNDDYPLSDQQNKGCWELYEPLTDEFELGFDSDKWIRTPPGGWPGRVSVFHEDNVQVYDGMLHIICKKETHPDYPDSEYTAALCRAKQNVNYGYFEIKAKPMASAASSAFWFSNNNNEEHWRTEIDVFEIGGSSEMNEQPYKYNMNAHKFKLPEEYPNSNHVRYPGYWISPTLLRADFRVYGLEWNKDEITWYVDGHPVYKLENYFWHQPLQMDFDTEIFVNWFGIPNDEELPGDFQVEYVRTWKKQ